MSIITINEDLWKQMLYLSRSVFFMSGSFKINIHFKIISLLNPGSLGVSVVVFGVMDGHVFVFRLLCVASTADGSR